MPDQMQNEAMERLRQMYSKANQSGESANRQSPHFENTEKKEVQNQQKKTKKPIHNAKSENILDIFMKDKEKSLIMLLIVLLISEKADTTLVLALMYLIL